MDARKCCLESVYYIRRLFVTSITDERYKLHSRIDHCLSKGLSLVPLIKETMVGILDDNESLISIIVKYLHLGLFGSN